MKILIEPSIKSQNYPQGITGLILPLKDFSVQSPLEYSMKEIKEIRKKNPKLELFISINKNISNNEIPQLTNLLKELDTLNLQGIFFYDLAILELKKECGLKIDLVWNQTHMVNNSKTCNYYYDRGVKYALLSKEITLEEVKKIVIESKITSMVEVVGMPSVAFSKRKLITNYYENIGKERKDQLDIIEKVTNKKYELKETEHGTSFFLKEVINATPVIKDLYEVKTPYIIMREYGIDPTLWEELIMDTKQYIEGNCQDNEYIEKYRKLGTNTNFFFQKTIYQVKKNV